MSYRSKTISKLLSDKKARESYIKAKLNQLIPSQIRAMRLREEWTQAQLADVADMKQARISAIETPGGVNFSLETLVRLAAAFKVGLQLRFVSYSEMLAWENGFSQDSFDPVRLADDKAFTAVVQTEVPPAPVLKQQRAFGLIRTGNSGVWRNLAKQSGICTIPREESFPVPLELMIPLQPYVNSPVMN